MTAQTRLASRVALAVGGLGGIAVIVAWAGAASSPIVKDQAGWGAVGVAGTFGVIAASLLWVVSMRQAVGLRATGLRAEIAAGAARARPATAGPASAVRDDTAGSAPPELVAAPAMIHYHRPGCRLAAAKPVERATRFDHEQAGRTPCGVCEP